MLERLEEERKILVKDAVREALRQQAQGNLQEKLSQGVTFMPRRAGTYVGGQYRRGWRFGMLMGSEKLVG